MRKKFKRGGFYWERELYQSDAFLSLNKNAIKVLIAVLDSRKRESKDQAKDIDDITGSMKQLEEFTMKSVNISNETANFGNNLSKEVNELDAITRRLKAIVYGARKANK